MSKTPYPGYNPSYSKVTKLGGLNRTCYVIELLSDHELSNVEIAAIQEYIEAKLLKIIDSNKSIKSVSVIAPDRFDTKLAEGLRL